MCGNRPNGTIELPAKSAESFPLQNISIQIHELKIKTRETVQQLYAENR